MSFLTRYRLYFLVAALVVTAGTTAIAPMIPMNADVTEFLPPDDEAARFWVDLSDRFGALNMLMVGLEEPGEPLRSESLRRVRLLTDELAERKGEGIVLARSITNLESATVDETGTINASTVVEAIPENEAKRDALRQRILADPQAPGSFVSKDLRAYVIILRMADGADSREVAQLVQGLVEKGRGDMPAIYFGAPFIETLITDSVYRQVPLVAGLFLLLLAIPIFLLVRRVVPVLLILGSAGVSLVWWLGGLQLLGIELTATASGAALVLLGLGAIVNARLVECWLNRAQGDNPSMLLPMLPLVIAGAVALGLLPLFFDIPYLAHFGQVAAVGMVAIALATVLLLLPAASYMRPRPTPGTVPASPRISPAIALGAVVLLLAGGGYAASQSRFLMSPRHLFAPDDSIGRANAFFDRHFGGNDMLQISARGDFTNPADVSRLMRLSDLLKGKALFSDVRDLSQIVGMLSERFGGVHRVPPDPEAMKNLWFFLQGNQDIAPLVTGARDEAMMAARIWPQTDRPPEVWVRVAQEAVEQSALVGADGAIARLVALRDALDLPVDRDRIERLVHTATEPLSPAEAEQRLKQILDELKAFMESDESPFGPTEEEWRTIRSLLVQDHPPEKLARAIAAMPGFQEWEYPPEVAQEVAETLHSRLTEKKRTLLADQLTAELSSDLGQQGAALSYAIRAKGIFVDLLDPVANQPDNLEITVSGFPAVIARVADRIQQANWLAALLLWAVMVLAMLAITRQGWVTLRAALEALVVTVLTFGLGWLTRLHVDSASAVVYLLPPIAAFLCSPGLSSHARNPEALPTNRLAPAIAFALACASLSLLVIDILPIFRIGAVMTLSLTLTASIAALARRVR